jgi:hypothetical protein
MAVASMGLPLAVAAALEQVTNQTRNRERTVATCSMFVMVGAAPNTEWLLELVALDEKGFVLTGEKGAGCPSPPLGPGYRRLAVRARALGSVSRLQPAKSRP